jgi:hypothetical protein
MDPIAFPWQDMDHDFPALQRELVCCDKRENITAGSRDHNVLGVVIFAEGEFGS